MFTSIFYYYLGVLKAVNCGHPEHGNRATKDVVAFHAQDYNELLEILMLDLYEPPQTQCTKWIEVFNCFFFFYLHF